MHIPNAIYLKAVLIVLSVSAPGSNCFTPEDASFAVERCRNISSADSDQKAMWTHWKFPDKKETHCYVKCVLEKLGLIDLTTRGLNVDKLMRDIPIADISAFEDSDFWNIINEELSGTCMSYYTKWRYIFDQYPRIFQKTFFVHTEDVSKFYKRYSYGAKRKGMKAIDFCVIAVEAGDLTETDSFQKETQCMWGCIFKHFRYFDAYGRMDLAEVISSFQDYDKTIANEHSEDIKVCVHRSNQQYPLGLCEMANVLHKCLANNVNSSTKVFQKRNDWTVTF